MAYRGNLSTLAEETDENETPHNLSVSSESMKTPRSVACPNKKSRLRALSVDPNIEQTYLEETMTSLQDSNVSQHSHLSDADRSASSETNTFHGNLLDVSVGVSGGEWPSANGNPKFLDELDSSAEKSFLRSAHQVSSITFTDQDRTISPADPRPENDATPTTPTIVQSENATPISTSRQQRAANGDSLLTPTLSIASARRSEVEVPQKTGVEGTQLEQSLLDTRVQTAVSRRVSEAGPSRKRVFADPHLEQTLLDSTISVFASRPSEVSITSDASMSFDETKTDLDGTLMEDNDTAAVLSDCASATLNRSTQPTTDDKTLTPESESTCISAPEQADCSSLTLNLSAQTIVGDNPVTPVTEFDSTCTIVPEKADCSSLTLNLSVEEKTFTSETEAQTTCISMPEKADCTSATLNLSTQSNISDQTMTPDTEGQNTCISVPEQADSQVTEDDSNRTFGAQTPTSTPAPQSAASSAQRNTSHRSILDTTGRYVYCDEGSDASFMQAEMRELAADGCNCDHFQRVLDEYKRTVKTELGNVSGVTEANASLRLDDWKELVGQLQESLQRYEGENSVLQAQKDALRAELDEERTKSQKLKNRSDGMQLDIKSYEDVLQDERRKLKELSARIATLEEQLAESQERASGAAQSLSQKLEQQLAAVRSTSDQQLSTIGELELEKSALSDEVADLRRRVAAAEEAAHAALADAETKQRELDALQAQNTELTAKTADAEARLEAAQQQNGTLSDVAGELRERLAAFEAEQQATASLSETQQQELSALRERNSDLAQTIAQLKTAVEASQEESSRKASETAALHVQLQMAQKDLECERRLAQEFKERLAKWDRTSEDLTELSGSLKTIVERYKEDLAAETRRNGSLETALAMAKDHITSLEADLEKTNTNAAANQRLAEFEAESTRKTAHVQALEAQLVAKNTHLEEMKTELSKAEERIRTIQAELLKKSERSDALEADVTHLKDTTATLEAQLLEKSSQLEEMKKEIGMAEERTSTTEENLKTKEEQTAALEAEVRQLKDTIVKSEQAAASLVAENTARIATLEAQLLEKTTELDTLKEQQRRAEERVRAAEANLTSKTEQSAALEAEVRQLKEAVAQSQEAAERVATLEQQLKHTEEQMTKTKQMLDEQSDELDEIDNRARDDKYRLEAELMRLRVRYGLATPAEAAHLGVEFVQELMQIDSTQVSAINSMST